MIVLEGCDKTGKTTLAQQLGHRLGWDIVAFGPPKTKNPYAEYMRFFQGLDKDVVLDRFHAGEFVYPVVYNRTTNMTRRHFRTIDLMLKTMSATVIHCHTQDKEFLREKFREEEELNSQSKIQLTQDLFTVYFEHVSMFQGQRFKYDIRLNNQRVFVDLVEDVSRSMATRRPFEGRRWLLDQGFQGLADRPRVMFVGEVVNEGGRKREFARPFDLSPSSEVLFDAISQVMVSGGFGIINSRLPDDKPVDLQGVVNIVKPKTVIALGEKAQLACLHGIDPQTARVRNMMHPGYAKRFLNIRTTQAEFNKELRQILDHEEIMVGK